MDGIVERFADWLEENNWQVEEGSESPELCDEFILRYGEANPQHLMFLEKFKQVISADEKKWFLCENEYNDESDLAFKWNEFEIQSLEAAEDDEELRAEIREWWSKHLPIVLSVGNGYEYYAIDYESGAVVNGYEPEYEEAEVIAEDLGEFLELIMSGEIEL